MHALSLASVFDFRSFYSKNVNESSAATAAAAAVAAAAARQVNFYTQPRKMRALCTHTHTLKWKPKQGTNWQRNSKRSLHSERVNCGAYVCGMHCNEINRKERSTRSAANSSNSNRVFNWGKQTTYKYARINNNNNNKMSAASKARETFHLSHGFSVQTTQKTSASFCHK